MKKIIRIVLVILFVLLFFWTFWFLYKKSQSKPIIYKTELPFVTNIIKKTVATGAVKPRNEIEIKPQVSGIIEELYVKPGQKIKKGDLVAKVRIIPNMLNLSNAENRINRAKITLEDAQRDFDRNTPLYTKGVISKSEYQRFETALKNAKEENIAANDNLQIIKLGSSSSSKSNNNTLIRSTVNGMVLDVPVEVGNSVIETNNFNAGTTIAFVADMNEMIFEGKVDESEVAKLKLGMDLILNIGAIDNQKFKAKLEYIAPKGVEEQGAIQFLIKAALVLDADVFLRAGYSANADIVLERKDNVLSIPEGLVLFEKEKTFVEIEKSNQVFEKKEVTLGLSDGINIEVISGILKTNKLKGGEVVEEKTDAKDDAKPSKKYGS
jgi:HlyD family secretion protein